MSYPPPDRPRSPPASPPPAAVAASPPPPPRPPAGPRPSPTATPRPPGRGRRCQSDSGSSSSPSFGFSTGATSEETCWPHCPASRRGEASLKVEKKCCVLYCEPTFVNNRNLSLMREVNFTVRSAARQKFIS